MEFIETFKRQLASTSRNVSKISLKNYLSDIRHFINWFEKVTGNNFTPEKITAEIIELYKSSQGSIIIDGKILEEGTLSSSSMKRHLSSMRKFVSVMEDENLITENPFEHLSQEKAERDYDYWHLDTFRDYLFSNTASKLTVKNYLADIRGFANWYEQAILPGLENPLTSTDGFYLISQGIVEEYKARLNSVQSSAPRTINRKLSSLRRYLEFAAKKGFIGENEITIPTIRISTEEVKPEIVTLSDLKNAEKTKPLYSTFPPTRLVQKLIIFPYISLEELAASKIASFMSGKKIIAGIALSQIDKARIQTQSIVRAKNRTIDSLLGVRNIKKEFYAPHTVKLSGLPLHQKIIYHARYTRPKWYKTYHSYPFVHYAHFALLIIFAVGVGVAAYQNLLGNNQKPTFASPTAPPRILSFQGRLTDVNDNPITSATDIRFAIYNDITASGAALLWQEVHYVVYPDQDGIFSVLLGTNTVIPATVFSDNSSTYLGVTINQTSELTPRQRIASVAYATNSEQLQGMPPITAGGAGTSNVVLALDSSGNLTIGGSANPTFAASGGQFKLSGQPLLLTTNTGSGGNVVISPDGLGKIDIQKPFVNTTATGNIVPGGVEVNDKFGVLATESAVASFVINNDGVSDIFTASSSGAPRFTIATTGILTIPTYNTNGGIFYANGSGTLAQTTAGSAGECLQSIGGGTPTWGSCGGSGSYWRLLTGALSPINDTLDLLIGSNASASAKFAFVNVGNGTPTASISANSGNNWTTLSGDGILGTTNKQTLTIGNSSTGNITINSPTDSKTTIGTTSTLGTLKIAGNSPGKALVNLQYLGTGQNILVASNSAGTNVLTIEEDGDIIVGNGGAGKITAAIIDPYLIQNQYTSVTPELIFQTMAASNGDFIYKNQSTELARLIQAGQFQLPITGSAGGLTLGGDTQLFRGAADRLDVATGDSINVVSGSLLFGGTTVIDSSRNGTFETLTVNGGCTGCVSASDSPFKTLSGAIVPHNSTLDFTLGGQSSASAKFAVLNIGTGTPTASISANSGDNALYITGDGTLATTNKQSLTIGNSSAYDTTGNVLINPNGTGNVGIGTTNPADKFNLVDGSTTIAMGNLVSTYGGINLAGSTVTTSNYGFAQAPLNTLVNSTAGGSIGLRIGNADKLVVTSAGNVGIGTTSPTALLDVAGTASVSGALKLYGTPTIQSTANQTLTLGGDTTGNITLAPLNGSGTVAINGGTLNLTNGTSNLVNFGSNGAAAPSSDTTAGWKIKLYDSATANEDYGIGIASAELWNRIGSNNSANHFSWYYGTTEIARLASAGSLQLDSGLTLSSFTSNGGVLYTNGSGVLAQTGAGSASQCLLGGTTPTFGSCSTGTNTSPFQELAGAIVPNNSTTDFLIGGQATTSAKFGILNIGNGTPTASISAGTAGGSYLSATGTLATTANQTLTLGNTTTGNIAIGTDSTSRTINTGNNTGATALNFTSGTSPQTFTSNVATGTTTTSGFVFDATAINSGTGMYLTTDSITTGKLLNLATTGNTLTSGTLLDLRTTATSLTGSIGNGSLLNLDWSPGSATTATGDLFALNIGTNGTTTGNLFNILDAGSSLFSVSETAVTSNLPTSFNSAGDVSIAYDLIFTNPTASYIKSSAPLNIQAGETFNSTDLTLGTYNKGNVVVDSEALLVNQSATISSQLVVGTNTAPANIGNFYLTNSATFGKALAILNQRESQDILTASSSGITKFVITNGGSLQIAGGQTIDTLAAGTLGIGTVNATTLTLGRSGQGITLPGFTTNGGLFYANGSGVLSQTGAGSASQCLLGGTTPTFGSCSTGTSLSPFQELTGAIVPNNSSLDFLIGGQATTSAKFGILNINSGTPTASISAGINGGLLITADGYLGTTNRQSLTIGNSSTYNTTGNILINPNGTGNVGIGTTQSKSKLQVNAGRPNSSSTPAVFFFNSAQSTNISSVLPSLGLGTQADADANGAHVRLGFYHPQNSGNTTDILSAAIDFVANSTVSNFGETGDLTFNFNDGTTGSLSVAERVRFKSTGNVGLGTNSPIAELHITRPLSFGVNGKALAVFDQIENQDILTASSSGTTKLVVTNGGSLQIAEGQTIDTLTNGTLGIGTVNATTLTIGRSGQGITLPGFTSQNGVLYGTNTTGVLAQATTASTGLCLLSGASNPAWGTCPTSGGSGSNWTLNSTDGTLYPINSTLDVLFGGTATSSAKFAFLNVAGGTPTASISANTTDNATFLTGLGNLATSNKQTLTLGGSTTGNIVIDSGSSAISLLDDTSISGNITGTGTTGLTLSGAGAGITFSGTGLHDIGASSGTLRIGTHTLTGAITGGNNNIGTIGNISANSSSNTITGFGTIGTASTTNFNGTTLTLTGGATDITSGANEDLTITANGTGSLILASDFNTGVKVGTSANILAPLSVSGGIGSNAGFILDQLNSGDLFTASAAGITKFTLTNGGSVQLTGGQTIDTLAAGTLGIGTTTATTLTLGRSGQGITLPGFTSQNGVLYGTNTTGVLAQATTASTGLCLLSGASNPAWGTCPGAGSSGSNWTLDSANGVIYPNNNTVDFLLGGTATTSAKFAVIGVDGTTVPTASISAQNVAGQALSLRGDGTIQSARNNTLTLGGDSTGNIVISPNNGSTGSLLTINSINQAWTGTTTLTASSLATITSAATLGISSTTLNLGAGSAATIGTVSDDNLTLTPNGTGDLILTGDFDTQVLIGATGATTKFPLLVRNGIGSNAALAIDNLNSGDLFAASASGITKFVIANDGRVGINTAASPTGVAPLAMFQIFSSLGTAPAASIAANTSWAALQINQEGVGDIFAASKSGGFQAFRIKNNGDVVVGDGGVGTKITVETQDPLYNIDGKKYSTFTPSMLGFKEEITGRQVLAYDNTAGAYSYKFDFNNAVRESDFWVFSRVIKPDIKDVSILMTPNSPARTWYKKDGTSRTITMYSDRPVEISYRMTAPQINSDKWPTIALPKDYDIHGVDTPPPPNPVGNSEGDNNIAIDPYFDTLTINEQNGQWILKDSYNNKVNHIDAFSKAIIARVESGWINAKKITTDSISTGNANIGNLAASTLSLTSDSITIGGQNIRDFIIATVQNAGLTQSGQQIISPLASIDQIRTNIISPLAQEGSVALHVNPNDFEIKNTQTGETVAKIDNQGNLSAKSASFSGTLESEVALFDSASISGTLAANSLEANNASVAGTLHANKIIANDIDLSDEALAKLGNNINLNTQSQASSSGSFTNGGNLAVDSLNAQFGLFEQGIVALGSATFGQITAIDSISIGQGFILGNNSINTLGADLEIQPLRQGNISFMAGRVVIDTDGNMAVDGNINITGNIAAARGIFSDTIESKALATNIISPLADSDLVFKLGSDNFASNSGKLQIQDTAGKQVLAINNKGDIVSSGSAQFGKISLNLVGKAEALNENESVATGSAGFATLKRGKPEITIINPNVTEDSLVYITPFGDTSNKVLYLLRQTPHDPEEEIQGSFTVGVSGSPTTQDLQFNWLVVN